MTKQLTKKDKLLVFATVLVLIVLLVGIYFFVLYPKLEKVSLKESELHSQEQLLSALQSKVTSANTHTFENTVSLQKKLPIKPMSQQLLLLIEKAEVISNSFVANISFADGELTIDPPAEENVDEQNEEATSDQSEGEKVVAFLPSGVKKITAQLRVESPSYFELEKFIDILENSVRIVVIEEIKFTANEEIIEEEQAEKLLKYDVILSAFYMPALTDLLDTLPKIQSPNPANKKNPLTNFGNVPRKDSQSLLETPSTTEQNEDLNSIDEIEQTPEQEQPSSPSKQEEEKIVEKVNKQKTYTVQPGDNLFRISLRFYQSQAGIEKIKNANNLHNETIFAGQTLLIPTY